MFHDFFQVFKSLDTHSVRPFPETDQVKRSIIKVVPGDFDLPTIHVTQPLSQRRSSMGTPTHDRGETSVFSYDHVFDGKSTQREVSDTLIMPLIAAWFVGYKYEQRDKL